MEGLIWYVLSIIEKRKGRERGVLLKLVELSPLDMRKKDTAGAFKNALRKHFFA